ncbi:MAG: hypothetical protein GSR80_000109 [Desulfurococcales archaeon]|nr:hypothetical protein [Desulfurococcales archaeon]
MNDRDTDDRETLARLLLTGPAQLLVWLRGKGGRSTLGEARRELGTKAYNHSYKLALAGLLTIKDREIELTDEGRLIAECLHTCLYGRE